MLNSLRQPTHNWVSECIYFVLERVTHRPIILDLTCHIHVTLTHATFTYFQSSKSVDILCHYDNSFIRSIQFNKSTFVTWSNNKKNRNIVRRSGSAF